MAWKLALNYLACTSQLEELTIAGVAVPFDVDHPSHSRFCLGPLLSQSHEQTEDAAFFPNLCTLTLDRVLVEESQLTRLVEVCAKTLHHLALGNLVLVKDAEDGIRPGCLVRVLEAIRTCRISDVQFFGGFTNLKSQQWQIEGQRFYGSEPLSLKARVEAWMAAPEEDLICPLEHAALRLDESGGEVATSVDIMAQSDSSWTILPYEPPVPAVIIERDPLVRFGMLSHAEQMSMMDTYDVQRIRSNLLGTHYRAQLMD